MKYHREANEIAASLAVIPLPSYIDAEAWAEYVQQRKRDKKPMTERSAKKRIERLVAIKCAGYDPNESLEEAINGHWLDFWPPQDKKIEAQAGSEAAETAKAARDAIEERRIRESIARAGFTSKPIVRKVA